MADSSARAKPGNPLHERYASAEMAAVFSAENRYRRWREIWITLAGCQQELGLEISDRQLAALRRAAPKLDLLRVAEIERATRHDVVAHLRHFKEQADVEDPDAQAGGILHLGATSAFLTDNTDVLLFAEALALVEGRLVAALQALAGFAEAHRAVPCLAYTHFQPAQLTTVGKRACLWAQDLLQDLVELRHRRATLQCRGAKGTTGTQASFLTLFDGDHEKVRRLDTAVAEGLGFVAAYPITGQTYSRKQDTRLLATLAGVAESCHKLATDIRLLQGVGELSEPFDEHQVGSSAMAYKRNPVRSERICGLARKVLTDSWSGPLNAATQWLERSLDDSSNRRLVLPDAFLGADAVLGLTAHVAAGLTVRRATVAARVARELPFMATETLLMEAVKRGGDRQDLHERLRRHSLEAQEVVEAGGENPLLDAIVGDPAFRLERAEVDSWVDPRAFTGRSPEQVDAFLEETLRPALEGAAAAAVEEPRV